MNTDGVVSLKEFLKSEIEGFDEMLVDTVIHGANMKHSKLKRRLHTEDQVQEHPNALTSASTKTNPDPSNNFPESSGRRFKTVTEQDLREIECNKYRIRDIFVFNGEYFTRMI